MPADPEYSDELEKRRGAEIARAHAAIAAAQDRSYWLDRWHLDLNALMRRRGASELRAAIRAIRTVYRTFYSVSDGIRRSARALPKRAAGATRVVRQEQAQAEAAGGRRPGAPSGRLTASPVSDRVADRIDGDDPQLLVALQRADALVDALARTGGEPVAGQEWLGLGTGAEAVLGVLGDAYPGLACRLDATNGAVDVAFAIAGWGVAESPLERVTELRHSVTPGGWLLLSADAHSGEEPLTAERVLTHCTPDWRVTLYLPGGMEGSRDLYVLERA